MRSRFIPMLIASAIFLAGCTGSSESATQNETTTPTSIASTPSPAPEFAWNKGELFEVNIEKEFIQALGYENFESENGFYIFENSLYTNFESVKPKQCEASVKVEYALGVKFLSGDAYFRKNGSKMSFIETRLQVYNSSEDAQINFSNFVAASDACIGYTALIDDEEETGVDWEKIEITNPQRILFSKEKGLAKSIDTYGVTGNVIWRVGVLQQDGSSDSLALSLSNELEQRLKAKQGISQ
jgi:hypothetical protein